ncbi:MAG: PIN domain nuclease [Rhodospirillales bacterium]|nr:PIN domain nuclease [Rhodospirillales bacterium]
MIVCVDSSVWIALLRGHSTPEVARLRAIEPPDAIVIGDLILLEVLQGARDEAHAARIERNLRAFPIEPVLTEARAVGAAALYRRLRARGITIRRTIDLAIGAFCRERGYALLHADRDFTLMAEELGLRSA